MSAQSYKNIIILERSSIHPLAGQLQSSSVVWFKELPLRYTSPCDKVLVFYNYEISTELAQLHPEFMDARPEGIDGYMHVLVDRTYCKVKTFEMRSLKHAKELLDSFRQYVVTSTVSNPFQLGIIERFGFYMYWSRKILSRDVGPIVATSGLLSRPDERLHHFTKKDLIEGPFPTVFPVSREGAGGPTTPFTFLSGPHQAQTTASAVQLPTAVQFPVIPPAPNLLATNAASKPQTAVPPAPPIFSASSVTGAVTNDLFGKPPPQSSTMFSNSGTGFSFGSQQPQQPQQPQQSSFKLGASAFGGFPQSAPLGTQPNALNTWTQKRR